MATTIDTPPSFDSTVNAQGRVVLPAELRRLAGIKSGDRVSMRLEDGQVVIRTLRQVGELMHAKYGDRKRSMADELIAERRAAAAAE
jgi:AbrB family looped-hinge helix DNA binding protein